MRNPKPPMEEGINGAWLLATVSTQALVILGSILLNRSGWPTEIALFCLVVLFFVGIALYAVVITMIVYRYTFKELLPKHFSPTYWINTGAMAITTLAGAELISHISHSYFLLELAPFLKGATLMAWGVATWWLPILFILGFWRYAVKKYPFTYTPEYWGMVFPMGMYTACTVMLSEVFELHFLMIIPEYFIFIACFAWGATFAGMIWSLIKGVLNIGMAIQ